MSRSSRFAWSVVTGLLFLVVVLVLSPPFVNESLRQQIMTGFAPLCHQLPDRSFSVGGVPFAVGHRCTGVYAGLLLGALALPCLVPWKDTLRSWSPVVLAGLLVVAGIDWIGPWMGEWPNTVASRMITGAVFGVGAGYYAAEGLTELLSRGIRSLVPAGISHKQLE